MTQQNNIRVIRYIRPTAQEANNFDNLHGITIIFDVDYITRTVEARWSVCNGDNFSRQQGQVNALKRKSFTFSLAENESLVSQLLKAKGYSRPEGYFNTQKVFLNALPKKPRAHDFRVGDRIVVATKPVTYSAYSGINVVGKEGTVKAVYTYQSKDKEGVDIYLEGVDYGQVVHPSEIEKVVK